MRQNPPHLRITPLLRLKSQPRNHGVLCLGTQHILPTKEDGRMHSLLTALKAAAEPTRLRLMALCAQAELSVSDLTQLLAQSQPRISRHLKLLCEAGLLGRSREGTFAFFRLQNQGEHGALAAKLTALIPEQDPLFLQDKARLAELRQRQQAMAEAYFQQNAPRWDAIRRLHAPEAEIETALLTLLPRHFDRLIDIGTGTGQ
jgi:DNA-binding transcriptional ArsR family regulator